MEKLCTTLFALLAVVLLTSEFQGSVGDNQNDFQTEKVKVIVKFRQGIFQPENYRHMTEDISSSSVQRVFKDFEVVSMEAVFKNRYNDDGKLKPEILQLENPHFLEGWRSITLGKNLANEFSCQLNLLSEVEAAFVEEPFIVKPAIVPNDPGYAGGGQWHLNDPVFPNADIRAEQAWDINRGRNDVVIAILDGGVDYNHLDMDPGNRSRVIAGIDTGDGDNDPADNLPDNDPDSFAGHGTSVAGVVGAITDNGMQVAGAMWNCRIMPVKMVRSGGIRIPHILDWDWSTAAFPSDVADALDYAVNNGAHVINLSYSFPDMGWPINEVALRIPLLIQAIDNAYRNNVVITASMGNDFETDNSIRYPAGFREQVMAVGATTRTRERANFSNTGAHISVSAPGVGIVTTERGGGVRNVSGTSFSAPLTAGVAGLVISQGRDRNFNLTNDDVRHIIELTAQDIGAVGFDNETGHGIVNARNALQLLAEPNVLYHYNSVGGTQTLVQNLSQWIILDGRWGLAAGTYINVDQYKITKHITFDVPFCSPPVVWMRERESKSLNYGNPNIGRPDAIITNITSTGFDLEYVAYFVRNNILGQQINKWVPAAPASTNVAYTAVGVPNLAATAGPINGQALVCSTGSYTLQNIPSGASVAWSSGNPNGLSINPTTGAATRINNFNGQVSVIASVNSGCGAVNITRNIWVGTRKPTGFVSVLVDPWLGRIRATVEPVPDATSYQWFLDGVQYTGPGMNSPNVAMPIQRNNCTIPFYIVGVKAINACGTSAEYYELHQNPCYGSFLYTYFPNPASGSLTIERKHENDTGSFESSTSQISTTNRTHSYALYDLNTNLAVLEGTLSEKTEIDVSAIPRGRYILKIQVSKEEEEKHHIILN